MTKPGHDDDETQVGEAEGIEVDLSATQVRIESPWSQGSDSVIVTPNTKLGRYQLKHLIGKGGMAEVFLASQDGPAGFEKICVVKRIRRSLVEEKRFVEMFLREARVAARLNHPNVVQIFELGEHINEKGGKDYFIAMEFLDGLSLHRAARRSWRHQESMPMEVALRATADAALGLHHAHTLSTGGRLTPLIHRDVSPDNVILTRDGNAKLLDFGIAKSLDVQEMTGTGEVKGKIPFMSPEQIQGQTMDGRTDLWSLGVTLYWLLTGRRPFDGPTEPMTIDNILRRDPDPPRSINPLVPATVDALVMQLLKKDQKERIRSGLDLAERLLAMLGPSSSYAAASAFVAHVAGMDDDAGGTASHPISLLTIIAARPESQWLKKLDSQSPDGLERLVPESTPTSPRPVTISGIEPDRTDDPNNATAELEAPSVAVQRAAPTTAKTVTGVNTADLVRQAQPRAWPIAAGVAAALVLALSSWQLLRTKEPAPTPPSQDGDPALVVKNDDPPPRPVDITPPPQPVDVTPPQLDDPPKTDPKPREHAEKRPPVESGFAVRVSGPGRISWRVGGKVLGKANGVVKPPKGTSKLTAVDPETGGSSSVPIVDGAASWQKLGQGTLVVRARPWGDVKLGTKALGQTPFDPVPLTEGHYELLLTRDAVTKRVGVDVTAGKTATINVDMRDDK